MGAELCRVCFVRNSQISASFFHGALFLLFIYLFLSFFVSQRDELAIKSSTV